LLKKIIRRFKSPFWQGFIQNALGGILAGFVTLIIAEHWAQKEIDGVVHEVQAEEKQLGLVRAEVDHIEQDMETLMSKQRIPGGKNKVIKDPLSSSGAKTGGATASSNPEKSSESNL